MKQRIRVVGIVRNEEGILVLKRSRSRSDVPAFWELPTGKIGFGEQPEEAVSRNLTENTGLVANAVKLKDVITFLALEGASRLNNLYIIYDISVMRSAKILVRGRYTAYKYIKNFNAGSGLRFDEASLAVLEIEEGKILTPHISPRATASSIIVQVDGASRGNPGASGIGYCVYGYDGEIIQRGGEFIGFATSRVAEYMAIRKGIELAKTLGFKSARFVSDSLMVVNQLNGTFAVKNRDVMAIYQEIQKLIGEFETVSFTYVPREQNLVADAEANAAIDRILERGR